MNHLKMTIIFSLSMFFSSLSWTQTGWFTYRAWYGGYLGYNYVSTIAIDLDNTKYFGHYGLQAHYDGIDYVSVYNKNYEWSKIYTGYNSGKAIAVDKNNIVWISDWESYKRNDVTIVWSFFNGKLKDHSLIPTPKLFRFGGVIESILVDGNNIKWISVGITDMEHNGGLVNYNDIDESMSVIGPSLRAGVIDNYNNLWGVNGSDFLMFYNGEEFTKYKVMYGFPIDLASDIIKFYNDNNVEIFVQKSDYASGIITVDNDNNVWIGVYKIIYYNEEGTGPREWISNGIACFDYIVWKSYNTDNSGIASNNINSIAVDRNNVNWIGTDAGVSRFDGETWTTFNTQNSGLCDNKVNAIAVEKNNTIWFGTDNGVSEYSGEIIPVSVDEETRPERIPAIRTYPNPFNPSTTIEFTMPEAGYTTITIYNMAGQKVRELASERMTAGTHRLQWDGKDDSGGAVSAGFYIARLKVGKMTATGKLVLVK